MNKIVVCIPSYRRPKVKTLEYLPNARVYVDESEYSDYVNANHEGADIVSCPTGVQGNVARIRNYILDEEFGNGADIVCIVDDDMTGVYFWEGLKEHKVEDFDAFLYKYSVMAQDMGVYLWGININQDAQNYREYSPFSFLSFIGGPFGVFINNGGGLRYDEKISLKEDYDMTLQHLNKFRRVLRVNKFFYKVKQSEQAGGCATYRSIKRELEQLELLERKWGRKIVRRDKNDRSIGSKRANAKQIDYNPIIKVPILGI